MANNSRSNGCVELCPPVRNRYFYGKLLDVFHFELEQNYFNSKRWLLNRLVTGYGVICGLDVLLASDGQSVVVTPGIAIDKCGHEIIVCKQSEPFPLPQPHTPAPPSSSQEEKVADAGAAGATASPAGSGSSTLADCTDTGAWCHLVLCYHECQADPSPALGGDCDTVAACVPGSIREQYRLSKRDGKYCPPSTQSCLGAVIAKGDRAALANYVTNLPCFEPCDDCCIPLANIQIPTVPSTYTQDSIQITIRPVVYTNDMIYNLMLAWLSQGQAQPRGGK